MKIQACPVCGKTYVNLNGQKKYCSRRCRQRARNGSVLRERVCPECGKTFSTYRSDQVYCSHICTERHWNRVRRREASRMHGTALEQGPQEGGVPNERKPKMPKEERLRLTMEEQIAEAQATWGAEALRPQDDDAMTYGNMLYL